MKRLTDADVLLRLLGEECDCCCECEHERQAATDREATPTRPQMLGKKMPPLTVIDTDQPFVVTYPERESPQLPQPGHQPQVNTIGMYAGGTVSGEESAAFSAGLLLDDGTVDFTGYRQIDHLTRTARMYQGNTERSYGVGPSPERPGAYSSERTPEEIQAAVQEGQKPKPVGVTQTSTPPTVENYTQQGATPEEVQENYFTYQSILIPGLGRCNGRPVLGNGYGGTPRSVGPVGFAWSRTQTYREDPGRGFDGQVIGQPGIVKNEGGTFDGQAVNLVTREQTSFTIATSTTDDGQRRYTYTTTERQDFATADLRAVVVAYKQGDTAYQDRFVVDIGQAGARSFAYLLYAKPDPTLHTLSFQSAGQVIEAHVLEQPNSYALAQTFYGIGGVPTMPTTYKDDPNALYSIGQVGEVLWYNFTPPAGTPPTGPVPAFTFRSPVIKGHGFQMTVKDVTQAGGPLSLSGVVPRVDGADIAGAWLSWTAFQDDAGMTLLLADADGVLVLPGLKVAQGIRVPWATLLTDLRQPGVTPVSLGVHPGFHSFPEDRGYLRCERGDSGSGYWIALGPWDAYRDVTSPEWRTAGLSKPRTRKAFAAGQARLPPAAVPKRPTHGLALWEVYASSGGIDT